MIKTFKKVILSSLSILALSMFFWMVILLNPNLSYANATHFDNITVYHNEVLEENTGTVLSNALNIIKNAEIYKSNISIHLCFNDDKVFPNLQPWVGQPMAYAFLDKTVIKNAKARFDTNVMEVKWAINNYELRKFDLTYLLAHEFMHNLQSNADLGYFIFSTMGNINWKLEGHAEYVSREYKNDGKLKHKINMYLIEIDKEHNGIPVFELEDGTKQSLSYFKYSLVIQYLMEEKKLKYNQICNLETSIDTLIVEMIDWSKL